MSALHLSIGTIDAFAAAAALMVLPFLNLASAQLIGTSTRAGGLPPELETSRISVVARTTSWTIYFDFVAHREKDLEARFQTERA